jgi:hypothetical protein
MSKQGHRNYANYRQASGLLLDNNLEWSADMESIRVNLGIFLIKTADKGDFTDPHLSGMVQQLIAEENDMSV